MTGLTWRKSSFSNGDGGGNECVELAALPCGDVAMRDSKLFDASPLLSFSKPELAAFIKGAKAGEFDDLVM